MCNIKMKQKEQFPSSDIFLTVFSAFDFSFKAGTRTVTNSIEGDDLTSSYRWITKMSRSKS